MSRYDITRILHEILGVSSRYFTFPQVITSVIIPGVLLWYAIYLLMGKLQIFRRTQRVNGVISLVFTFYGIRFFLIFPLIASFAGLGMMALEKQNWPMWIRVLFPFGVVFLIHIILPPLLVEMVRFLRL